MLELILLTIVFSLMGAATTILLGDRGLLQGNMLTFEKIIHTLFHWRFIVAMICALFARYAFMMINSNLLKNPILAHNSTTVTTLITSISFVFLLIGNFIFFGEKLGGNQAIGAVVILLGTWIVLK